MATQLQIRRGTSSQVAAFTGAEGEIVVNTTNDSVHVNDGSTAGGFELARADLNNVSDASLNAALTGNTVSALTITTLTLGSTAITATGAEINILDGVTATAAELNILDGVTATTAELNYVDGVTSAIQTQIDAKAPLAQPQFTNRVGIGVAAHASDALNITSTNQHIRLNNGSELGILALTSDGDLDFWAHGADEKINFRTGTGSGTVAMNVVGTNVGIGVSAPSRALEVSTDGTAQFRLSRVDTTINGGNTIGTIEFMGTDDTSGTVGATIAALANTTWGGGSYPCDLAFSTMTGSTLSEAMRISGGNLLVGKTALGVGNYGFAARADTGGSVEMARDGGTVLYVNRGTSDGQLLSLRKDNTEVGSIGTANSGDLYIGNDDTSLLFAGGSDAILPRGTAGATRDAAIDLGLTNHRFKDIYLSGGVNFSANANASGMSSELFSDYEIGTWTPTVAGVTISVGRANYTKVGRAVVLDFNFVITSTGHTGDSFVISGIPFTASSANSETIGSLMIRYAAFPSSTTQATLYHYSRAPTIYIYLSRDNANWTELKRNDFTSSAAAIIGTITLVVD